MPNSMGCEKLVWLKLSIRFLLSQDSLESLVLSPIISTIFWRFELNPMEGLSRISKMLSILLGHITSPMEGLPSTSKMLSILFRTYHKSDGRSS